MPYILYILVFESTTKKEKFPKTSHFYIYRDIYAKGPKFVLDLNFCCFSGFAGKNLLQNVGENCKNWKISKYKKKNRNNKWLHVIFLTVSLAELQNICFTFIFQFYDILLKQNSLTKILSDYGLFLQAIQYLISMF